MTAGLGAAQRLARVLFLDAQKAAGLDGDGFQKINQRVVVGRDAIPTRDWDGAVQERSQIPAAVERCDGIGDELIFGGGQHESVVVIGMR